MDLGIIAGALEQGLVYGVMALGVYLTFRALNFPDLTVDGSFPLGGAVAATLIVGGHSPILATVAAAGAGVVAGFATGFLHTRLKISGLLAGILSMTALYSVNLRIMGRANVPLLRARTVLTLLEELGIPAGWVPLLLFLLVAVALKLLLDWFLRTETGLALRATGDNEQMIRSAGVDTDAMKLLGLGLSNGLVALSGALVAQYQGFTDIGMGIGMIIAGLASVIMGEVLIRSRRVFWATLSALVGSLLYRFLVFVALRLGFAPTDLKLVTAVLVVVALAAPGFQASVRGRIGAGRGRMKAKGGAVRAGA